MNQWQQFMSESTSLSPVYDITQITADDTIICDLSHLGLLQLQGADAVSFLQGQVTNDVKKLDSSHAHYSGYCSPKGRLIALFLAFSQHGGLTLQLPKELLESVAKRLKMYILRSKVEINDTTDTVVRIGLCGANAGQLLSTIVEQIPLNTNDLVTQDQITIIRLAGDQPRFEILTDVSHAVQLWGQLSAHCKVAHTDHWEWLEIQAGIPEIYLQTQDAFVPQMLNLDRLDGINFKKGCYTGQEIVARTHYLGTIKRRMQLVRLKSELRPQLGDDIHDAQQQIIGKIVRVARGKDGNFDLLTECRLESFVADGVYWNNLKLDLSQLPYSLNAS